MTKKRPDKTKLIFKKVSSRLKLKMTYNTAQKNIHSMGLFKKTGNKRLLMVKRQESSVQLQLFLRFG